MKHWKVYHLIMVGLLVSLAVFGIWTVRVHAGNPYMVQHTPSIRGGFLYNKVVIARSPWPNPFGQTRFYSAARMINTNYDDICVELTELTWSGESGDVDPRQNQLDLACTQTGTLFFCDDRHDPSEWNTALTEARREFSISTNLPVGEGFLQCSGK